MSKKKIFLKLLLILFLWIAWGIVILYYPAPESIETIQLNHFLFFVPLFFAIIFTLHLLTNHPRRSILAALGILTLAVLQLYRMVSIPSVFLLLAALTTIELSFWKKPWRSRSRHPTRLLRRFPKNQAHS